MTKKYADRLLDVHMKDVSEATSKGHAVEIGRGVINIPRFLRTLIRIDYSGIVSFEYEKDAEDPMAGLAESVGYVRGVLAAI
jgi:sugar phosphate isomerase/epimerase